MCYTVENIPLYYTFYYLHFNGKLTFLNVLSWLWMRWSPDSANMVFRLYSLACSNCIVLSFDGDAFSSSVSIKAVDCYCYIGAKITCLCLRGFGCGASWLLQQLLIEPGSWALKLQGPRQTCVKPLSIISFFSSSSFFLYFAASKSILNGC